MAKNKNDTGLEAIRIEGGLLSSSLLSHLRHYQLPGQKPEEYSIEKGLKLSDELGRYWRIAQARWQQFIGLQKRDDLDNNTLAVEDWLHPLLSRVLGFQIDKSQSKKIGERIFPISHTAFNGSVPFVLTSAKQLLETGDPRFGEEGRKRSPAGLLQEYLNAEERCLWGIVCNGLTLRLLRDNPAMTRPAYVEIDLVRLFTEELYVDFTVFWLLLHATRFESQDKTLEGSLLEQWCNQGQTDGERVLGELRHGVTHALRIFGTGFITHPDNKTLRDAVKSGELTTDQFFQELLRLIYRFLFLFTTEDRNILLDPAADLASKNLYTEGYSVTVLRERSRFRRHYDKYGDAWQQLCITFEGFTTGQPLLAQPALGGLFVQDQCPQLEQAQLTNRYLYDALFKLCYFESNRVLTRINYRDMDTEELGSVYESLLELVPRLNIDGHWSFGFMGDEEGEESAAGHTRKLTGSYYTPDSLVQELIKSALEPVIEDRLANNEGNPREALLAISVCDPACGSGHFLLAAARRLAVELARIEAGTDQPTEAGYRHALREVVSHCIYGVDINPLAVELCRTALWLEAVEPGKPLSYLDHHIQCGNSLIGATPALLKDGIPNDAFKPIEGDDRAYCTTLKEQNRRELAGVRKLWNIEGNPSFQPMRDVVNNMRNIEHIDDSSIGGIHKKQEEYEKLVCSDNYQKEYLLADSWCASFVWEKVKTDSSPYAITEELFRKIERNSKMIPRWVKNKIARLARQYQFFHWHLAFPDIFKYVDDVDESKNSTSKWIGGFDVILGNPPWESLEFKEKEWFSSKAPEISNARNSAKRKILIRNLKDENPSLYVLYNEAVRYLSGIKSIFRGGGYPYCGRGKMNTYALFAELNGYLLAQTGYAGFIVQSDIATGNTYKLFFESLLSKKKLISFYDFQNKEKLFAGLDTRNPHFCLITIGPEGHCEEVDFSFWNTNTTHLSEPERHFTLTLSNLIDLNPNTKTCPIFRTKKEAEITKKVYRKIPVFLNESKKNGNPWGVKLHSGLFNMASSSHLFRTRDSITGSFGHNGKRNWIYSEEGDVLLPLYEGKMTWQFDHRWATYESTEIQHFDNVHKENTNRTVLPQYWVKLQEFEQVFDRKIRSANGETWRHKWFLGYRDITNTTNERTVIASIIPKVAANHKYHIVVPSDDNVWAIPCLIANLNSLAFDFIARQKYSSTSLSDFFVKQFPVLAPNTYLASPNWFKGESLVSRIRKLVIELVYTAEDLRAFADSFEYLGNPFSWNIERRIEIKAELDAIFFILYGFSIEESEHAINSFTRLEINENRQWGEYKSKNMIMKLVENYCI